MTIYRYTLTGMIAGAISAAGFALLHDIFISDIWFSLPFLLAAGAICGLCLGFTYGLLFSAPTIHTWMQYNALYVGMFVLIGLVSVLVYEPVTTVGALMTLDGPPDFLFRQAMPVTILSTVAMAAVIGRLYARAWTHYAAVLLTSAVLVLLLGLNVSVMGLVAIPRGSVYLIGELAFLIFALNAVFAVVFVILDGYFNRLKSGNNSDKYNL